MAANPHGAHQAGRVFAAAQVFRKAECLSRSMGALTFGWMLILVEVDGAPMHGICSVIVQSWLRTTTVAGQAGPKT